MDAEEDVQDRGQLCPGLNAFQSIVLLLCSERAFHPRCPNSGQLVAYDVILFLLKARAAPLHKRSLYASLSAVFPVGVAGIACVSTDFLHIHSEESAG